jgi:NAD(P)-dependent dehydrogenase (short-subunit alcohol dehydrogenase family)
MQDTVADTSFREGVRGSRGKNVLVTGGTSGIGRAIAMRFAASAASVAISYPGSLADHRCFRAFASRGHTSECSD